MSGEADHRAVLLRLAEADIQRVAERVAALLDTRENGQPAGGMIDAGTPASTLDVDRQWVYAHRKLLGGLRLGGPSGRLRFDPARAHAALADRPLSTPSAAVPATTRRPCSGRRHRAETDKIRTSNISGRAAHQRPRPDTGGHISHAIAAYRASEVRS
jgi:hypothetical protein